MSSAVDASIADWMVTYGVVPRESTTKSSPARAVVNKRESGANHPSSDARGDMGRCGAVRRVAGRKLAPGPTHRREEQHEGTSACRGQRAHLRIRAGRSALLHQ